MSVCVSKWQYVSVSVSTQYVLVYQYVTDVTSLKWISEPSHLVTEVIQFEYLS